MKQFNTNTKHWIVVSTILVVSVLISLFYWFQFRPTSIRANCQREIDERTFKIKQIATSSSLSLFDIVWAKKHGFNVPDNKNKKVVEQSQADTNKNDAPSIDAELNELLGINEIFTEEEKQTFYQECLYRHGLNK